MQNQKSHNLPKFIITMTIILFLGTLFGVVSYYLTRSNNKIDNQTETKTKDIEKISDETDISDWKTYRNEEYGFEIKYLKDWAMHKHKIIPNGIYFSNVGQEVFMGDSSYPMNITTYQNAEEFIREYNYSNFEIIDIKDYLEKYSNINDPEIGDVEKFNISGIEGYSAGIYGMGGGTNYYISASNHFYIVNFWGVQNKLINQILSTLRFI